jgi:hypothetical protein
LRGVLRCRRVWRAVGVLWRVVLLVVLRGVVLWGVSLRGVLRCILLSVLQGVRLLLGIGVLRCLRLRRLRRLRRAVAGNRS